MHKFEWEVREYMPLDELARHIALDNMQAEERRQQEAQQRFKAKFKQRK